METQRKAETPIDSLLKERGIKIGWLMERTGIGYARLRDLRRGTSEPRASEIAVLCSVFQVPAETFIPRCIN